MLSSVIDFDKERYELSYGDRRGIYHGPVNEDGEPDGTGVLEVKNKNGHLYSYSGDFVDGHFEGKGRIRWYGKNTIEVGTYKNDEIIPEKLNEGITDIIWNAGGYIHRCIEFTGAVEGEPEYNEDFISFNVICDLENNDNSLTVNVYDIDFEIDTDDHVRVVGIVESHYIEGNSDGEEKTVPIIVAYEYDVISYEEAISPELFEKDPDKEYLRPVWYTK